MRHLIAALLAFALFACSKPPESTPTPPAQPEAPAAQPEVPPPPSSDAGPAKIAADGEVCGTIVGITCGAGSYCAMEPGTCTVADGAGKCTRIPEICTREYNPVCGCDGKTYPNPCGAAAAGVNVDKPGECQKGAAN